MELIAKTKEEEEKNFSLSSAEKIYDGDTICLWWSGAYESFYLDLLEAGLIAEFTAKEWTKLREVIAQAVIPSHAELLCGGGDSLIVYGGDDYVITANGFYDSAAVMITIHMLRRHRCTIRLYSHEWDEIAKIMGSVDVHIKETEGKDKMAFEDS